MKSVVAVRFDVKGEWRGVNHRSSVTHDEIEEAEIPWENGASCYIRGQLVRSILRGIRPTTIVQRMQQEQFRSWTLLPASKRLKYSNYDLMNAVRILQKMGGD